MKMQNLSQSYATDIARQVAVFPALKTRRQHQSNIWFFDSPKNNERLTITSDLAFMHLVLLEGDDTVLRYIPKPGAPQSTIGAQCDSVDAHVVRINGTTEWWDFERMQPTRAKPAQANVPCDPMIESLALAGGATYHVKTDRELADKEVLFDNWLTLCAAITRCRGVYIGAETEVFAQRMALQRSVLAENLLAIPGIDVACMLAVIALALQTGSVRTNLDTQLFGRNSSLSRSEP